MSIIPLQHFRTINGVPVFFLERHELPMVEISIDFTAGSRQDGKQYGIAHLTNAMLRQGSKNYDAHRIAQCLASVGARYHADADRDRATISLLSLTKKNYLDKALTIFKEILSSPLMPEKEFARLQKIVISALMHQAQMPEAIARNAFYSSIYPHHPYGHSILGSIETVSSMRVDDLRTFYQRYYTAKNVTLTVVGDLHQKKAEQLLEEISSSLITGKTAPKPMDAPNINHVIEQRIFFPSEQVHILIGQVGISYHTVDYFPFIVGNYILGGSELISRLFKEIRGKQGIAYNIMSGVTALEGKGPFAIVLQTSAEEAERAVKMVIKILTQFILKGPTEKELIMIKKKMINDFPVLLSENQVILNYLRMMNIYHLQHNYLDEYCKKISDVTVSQIKYAFQKHLHLQQLATIMVGKVNHADGFHRP